MGSIGFIPDTILLMYNLILKRIQLFCSVERAVDWGREHQNLYGIKAIGIDEIAWQRGHRYLTLVYPIDEHCKRLLWVGEKRTIKTLLQFFHGFGKQRSLRHFSLSVVTCGNPT